MTDITVSREVAKQHAADDPMLQHMLDRGMPLTRETYIARNWPDEPEEWTAEHEMELPACFRKASPAGKNYDVD